MNNEIRFKILFLLAMYSERSEAFLDQLSDLAPIINTPEGEAQLQFLEGALVGLLEVQYENLN